jgi:hypothetical protein
VTPRSAFLRAAALSAALLLADDARSFCRTTTVPLDASTDDPSVSGHCWTPGMDIAWPSGRVPYGVSMGGSKYFTAEEVTPIADQAFATWNDVACAAGSPSVQAYDVGPLTFIPDGGGCTVSSACEATTNDVIVFDDDVWPHDDPNNTLALTTVTYGLNDGRIFQAYTEVNTAQQSFTLQEPPPSGSFDLQSVLTHEAGHFLGLSHSTVPSAVMWAFYMPEHTQLTPDDEAGLCAIYPPKTAGSGCQPLPSETSWDGMAMTLGLSALVVSCRRRRSRSPN